jgi:hypothetical protein
MTMNKYVGVGVMITLSDIVKELIPVPTHEVIKDCAAHVHLQIYYNGL